MHRLYFIDKTVTSASRTSQAGANTSHTGTKEHFAVLTVQRIDVLVFLSLSPAPPPSPPNMNAEGCLRNGAAGLRRAGGPVSAEDEEELCAHVLGPGLRRLRGGGGYVAMSGGGGGCA